MATNESFETPVLLVIFNRQELIDGLVSILREIKPKHLYIAADGPRPSVQEDLENCTKTRQIIDLIDWDCSVKTNFQDTNLGCGLGVSTAISWFFDNVKEGIIIEDDCRPDTSFFIYCQELLEHYRDDERMMAISGDNFGHKAPKSKHSYLFTYIPHVWGWATWKRAWDYFDLDVPNWGELRDTDWLSQFFNNKKDIKHWYSNFNSVYEKKLDTWDYQWTFSCLCQRGLTIVPGVNLVSNVGFDEMATHTKEKSNAYANLPTSSIQFPLIHPDYVFIDSANKRRKSRFSFW